MASQMRIRSLTKDEEDDYWGQSTASKIKDKFNPFNDDVDLSKARLIMLNSPGFLEDAEETDSIEFEGFDISGPGPESARFRPPPASSGPSGARPDRGQSAVSANHPSAHNAGIPQGFPDSADLEDHVQQNARKPLSLTMESKLAAEFASVQRQLQEANRKLSPKETVKRIIHGLPYSLEVYKSKSEKLNLLDEAIHMYDGNAILATVLFLRNTIKSAVFNFELMSRPVAVSHYISYLQQMKDWKQLIDCYGMLGRSEEAAMLRYKQAVSKQNPSAKIQSLKECYRTHFQLDSSLQHDSNLIQEHISLIERQQPIEDSDMKAVESNDPKFQRIPRNSLLNKPVLPTLYYCCLYHYDLGETCLASPTGLRKAHNLTDKQFTWTALTALAQLERWDDIEELFKTKGWFGGTKLKAVIGFDKVVQILHVAEAPRKVLNQYCLLIDDTSYRLEIGKKYGCHEAVIETYKGQRDRVALEAYWQNNTKQNSLEWFYAQDCLKSNDTGCSSKPGLGLNACDMDTKWKN